MLLLFSRRTMSANDLRASEGRETKAPNNKPITNLKEKSELSNYCKTSGFRLHAVISCQFPHSFFRTINLVARAMGL